MIYLGLCHWEMSLNWWRVHWVFILCWIRLPVGGSWALIQGEVWLLGCGHCHFIIAMMCWLGTVSNTPFEPIWLLPEWRGSIWLWSMGSHFKKGMHFSGIMSRVSIFLTSSSEHKQCWELVLIANKVKENKWTIWNRNHYWSYLCRSLKQH